MSKSHIPADKGVSALARRLGISPSTVSKKFLAGKSELQIIEEAQDWCKKKLIYEAKRQAPEQPGEGGKAKETLQEANLRKEIALADKHEYEAKLQKGELVEITKVNAFVAGMIIRAREILTKIAPELCDVVAQTSDPIRIRTLIEAEVNRALAQLAEYRLD